MTFSALMKRAAIAAALLLVGSGLAAAPASAYADSGAGGASPTASARAASYCYSYENITPGNGAWYKIPRAGNTYNCILESGNNSVAVTVLQQTLNRCYGRGIAEDGAFGPATYNALMYAQSVEGIGVDGVYGPTTRSHIKWWGGGSICTRGSQLGL
ncbi:peptidoglycan-binding domain-containing protein [Microbacterium sp. Yaish 1]|uniref:peptidoglycan-binding domain-containing protein n=1 Tax=Microbacterium sp. Yaish 1 TaxID=2025014 RepID=UPI00211AB488|nr:peptidoglycan-binding domain-containing protein [Microbacterium sp. Yaish 1]